MTRSIFLFLVAASAALFASARATAHGCHRGWQQAPAQGWHSHGATCETRPGIGVSQRVKRAKRRAG